MADLGDIKDAGIIAAFVRWGWPWHGLIESGTIGSTGKAHTQPDSNDAWLIDKGLAALDLTPEQIAAYAADGMEWRNYALIPRGYVYNTAIGEDAYIHVDEAGDCWLVDLAFSFPATNTVRITATIGRFGLLVVDNDPVTPSTIEKTVDVSCTNIELAAGLTLPLSATYQSRAGELHDVYTNGSKALVGVMLTDDQLCKDMLSLVEVTFSGIGGADGSTLVMDAVEIMDQPDLTSGEWGFAPVYQSLYTRYAYYKAGVATAMAISARTTMSTPDGPFNGYVLLENNVVVDMAGWTLNDTPQGSLAAYYPSGDLVGSNTGIGFIWRAFRHVNDSYLTEDIELNVDIPPTTFSGKILGLHRMRSKAVAFIMTGTENRYGTVITPVGHLTLADAPNQDIQFAWQRKTDDYTFANSTGGICFV